MASAGASAPRAPIIIYIGWLALATALVTALLITYGSWVRVSGSGLGCPNWPQCGGAGTAAHIEAGHRGLAGVATLLTLCSAGLAWWRRREAPKAALLLMASAAMILGQVVLGAVTVLTDLHGFARLGHLALAMAILGLTTAAGLMLLFPERPPPPTPLHPRLLALLGAAVIMVGGSIVATQTSFDCPVVPLCRASAPPMAQWLHAMHRLLAVALLLSSAAVAWHMRSIRAPKAGVALAIALAGIAVAQVVVGLIGVTQEFPGPLRILHLGLATLAWWALTALWVVLSPQPRDQAPAPRR